jgi:hypothetical protein
MRGIRRAGTFAVTAIASTTIGIIGTASVARHRLRGPERLPPATAAASTAATTSIGHDGAVAVPVADTYGGPDAGPGASGDTGGRRTGLHRLTYAAAT